jgi:hypothetical protein
MHKSHRYLFSFSSLMLGVFLLRAEGNHWEDVVLFIPMNLWTEDPLGILLYKACQT